MPNIIAVSKSQVAELVINLAYGGDNAALQEVKQNCEKLSNDWRKIVIEKAGGLKRTRRLA